MFFFFVVVVVVLLFSFFFFFFFFFQVCSLFVCSLNTIFTNKLNSNINGMKLHGRRSFLAYQTKFSAIFTFYLTYSYLTRGIDKKKKKKKKKKTNNIGCVEGHVILSLGHCELTHCDVTWRLLSYNQTLKINSYARKRIYHDCLMRIEKNPSLGITLWHRSAKPRDAKQWPSDGYYYPHTTPMKDSYNQANMLLKR